MKRMLKLTILLLFNSNRTLDCLYYFAEFILKFFFAAFGQLNLHIVRKGDWCLVIVLVMSNVIKVDQVGFVGTKKIIE